MELAGSSFFLLMRFIGIALFAEPATAHALMREAGISEESAAAGIAEESAAESITPAGSASRGRASWLWEHGARAGTKPCAAGRSKTTVESIMRACGGDVGC